MKMTTIYKEEALYALTMAGFGAVLAGLFAALRYSNVKCREIRHEKKKNNQSKQSKELIVHGITFRDPGNSGFLKQELNRLAINTNNLRQMDGGAMGDGNGGLDGHLPEREFMDQLTEIYLKQNESGIAAPTMYMTRNSRTNIGYITLLWMS